MPSLVRFLTVIAVLAALVYGGIYALAHFVEPKPREITVSIPPEKFFKNR
ncbi:MAG: histidine kinase [Xanthobacteraceae bacterium]